MRSATRVVASAFGALAALVGMEHGVGEILQGSTRPAGLVIQSWPGAAFFRAEAGEPAMTVIPDLLVSGTLTCLVCAVFLVWAVRFVDRRHAGPVLLGLSVLMLLVGGGFGPPLLGMIVGLTATRIGAPLTWWRVRLAPGIRRLIAAQWPWAFVACMVAWLGLVPGIPLLSYTFGIDDPALVTVLVASAFSLLAVTIVAGLARDAGRTAPVTGAVPG